MAKVDLQLPFVEALENALQDTADRMAGESVDNWKSSHDSVDGTVAPYREQPRHYIFDIRDVVREWLKGDDNAD